jgi:hypothetical protein
MEMIAYVIFIVGIIICAIPYAIKKSEQKFQEKHDIGFYTLDRIKEVVELDFKYNDSWSVRFAMCEQDEDKLEEYIHLYRYAKKIIEDGKDTPKICQGKDEYVRELVYKYGYMFD